MPRTPWVLNYEADFNHGLLGDNRFADALQSAEHLERYSPLTAQSHMILGFAYLAGQPDRALAAFKRAHELTLPNQFTQILEDLSNRPAYKKVIEDKSFVSKVTGS